MMGLQLDSQLIIKIRENSTTIDSILTIKRVIFTIFRRFHPIILNHHLGRVLPKISQLGGLKVYTWHNKPNGLQCSRRWIQLKRFGENESFFPLC